jgi:hypothetical protein
MTTRPFFRTQNLHYTYKLNLHLTYKSVGRGVLAGQSPVFIVQTTKPQWTIE